MQVVRIKICDSHLTSENGGVKKKMVPSLPLLYCEWSVSVKEKSDRKQTNKQTALSLPLIEVEETSRKKTAFTTHFELFQDMSLPFGLINSPASFQRLLEHVIRDYIGKFVILYIDDILILVTQVLQTLKTAYLKV